MFGKYIPCRDAAITKLDAKDIMHDPSAYRLLACMLACLPYVWTMSMAYQYSFTNCLLACLLAWSDSVGGCRDEAALLVMGAN